ncbi:hypothetical protein [Mycolicibacterium brisbanense]|uniref:N-formimino-L-glutamate deiminase n=1 Tax=Mycolicibacterium brisbanense TaxID=146020 RepID=A0A100VWQ9_9MYCO|nr:hypothetical protein [Mycolicibacterium brisbanense]MCV7161608.1 hypothetical protein [Mycolicibacterium brisbanense]GAS87417.1 N-formimino-L-glutamate deiminase [Mycolicibacterium brisbanense]
MNFSSTGSQNVQSVSCCLLFDPQGGEIHHVHRVVTMEGAPDTSQAELEAQTLRAAQNLGLDTKRLQVLHVGANEFSERARYSVDPAKRTLKKEALPSRTGLRGAKS